jgi:hypothetical protein
MSWTSAETVKKHLFDLDKLPTEYRDVPIRIGMTGLGELLHKAIVTNSESIKQLEALEPTVQAGVVLNGENWTDLTYTLIKPGEIVVATDDGLQTVYQLDAGYAVDWEAGKLRRINGGSIGSGASVQVYYQRYWNLTRDLDYTIDYSAGQISVTVSGALKADTLVWVDYSVSASSGADQLIDEAINEAENKILARLKSGYGTGSTDQGLETGATELTLSIVCRGLATRALADGNPAAEGRSRAWRKLAEQYESNSVRTLQPFLNSPVVNPGGKRANQSWSWA